MGYSLCGRGGGPGTGGAGSAAPLPAALLTALVRTPLRPLPPLQPRLGAHLVRPAGRALPAAPRAVSGAERRSASPWRLLVPAALRPSRCRPHACLPPAHHSPSAFPSSSPRPRRFSPSQQARVDAHLGFVRDQRRLRKLVSAAPAAQSVACRSRRSGGVPPSAAARGLCCCCCCITPVCITARSRTPRRTHPTAQSPTQPAQGPSAREQNRDSTSFERARAEWGKATVSHRGKVGAGGDNAGAETWLG